MDQDLLRLIYSKYAKEIYLYLYSLCKSHSMSEELVQDVFVKAIISLSDDHPNFRAWLYKVAHNLCINRLRKEQRIELYDEIPDKYNHSEISCEDGLSNLLESEKNMNLYRCLNRLPAIQREVIFMEYFSELDHTEIASALNIKPGNVRVIAHRARKELRNLLEGEKNYEF